MSGLLLYLLGLAGEIFVLTSVYLVMPVGRPSAWHALLGAVAAAMLWEVSRHVLVWYYATLSQIGTVYGSLTTAIAELLSLEIAATLLLLGAQEISEYERLGESVPAAPAQACTTGAKLIARRSAAYEVAGGRSRLLMRACRGWVVGCVRCRTDLPRLRA